MSDMPLVLVISEDVSAGARLQELLSDLAIIAHEQAADAAQAILEDEWVRVAVLDQRLPDGGKLKEEITERWPDIVTLPLAPLGMGLAKDQPKGLRLPLMRGAARAAIQDALDSYERQRADTAAQAQTSFTDAGVSTAAVDEDGIVRAEDSPMQAVCEKLAQIAHYDIPVLLTGESGTGKELAARALHARSLRWNKPFVVENCGALPDELLESELFGHVRGAFTGAVADHEGLFARADGGTVFLDEVGELSPAFQVKLLRVLQEGEVRKLGGRTVQRVNVRVIAATNRNLDADVAAGRFREDLYYRLATMCVALPALRERPMDVPVLAQAFLQRCQSEFKKPVDGLAPETLGTLCQYEWPGNVRELLNEIKHMVVMSSGNGAIEPSALSPKLATRDAHEAPTVSAAKLPSASGASTSAGSLRERIEALEATILAETLHRHRGNKSRAARELGLSRVGLRAKLQRYGLMEPPSLEDAASVI